MFDNRRRVGAICSCGHKIRLVKNWHGPTPKGGIRCPKCEKVVGFEKFGYDLGTNRWPKEFPK